MSLAIVQSACKAATSNSDTTADVIFGAAPTNGNLLIVLAAVYQGNGAASANTGWHIGGTVTGAGGAYYEALYYKYAGAGESTTQQFDANGRNFWGAVGWEISGVSGTWATDFVAFHASEAGFTGVSSGSGPSFTTANNNELILQATAGSTSNTITSVTTTLTGETWTHDQFVDHAGLCYADGGHYAAASGVAISSTVAPQMGGSTGVWIEMMAVELKAVGGSTETATVSMALSGVGFAGRASDTHAGATLALPAPAFSGVGGRKETPVVGLALAGVAFSAQAHRVETATVTMSLNGVVIAAAAYDLNALNPVRQFSTFG